MKESEKGKVLSRIMKKCKFDSLMPKLFSFLAAHHVKMFLLICDSFCQEISKKGWKLFLMQFSFDCSAAWKKHSIENDSSIRLIWLLLSLRRFFIKILFVSVVFSPHVNNWFSFCTRLNCCAGNNNNHHL